MNGGEEHSFEQPRASWRRHVVLAVVICAGLGLSLVGFAVVRGTEQRQTQMVFDHEADGLTSVTELDLETCSQELAALGRFYDGSKLVDREEFLAFVGPVLARHAGIYAFEWLPRVAAAERSAHEQTAREDGIDGYRINQRQAQGALAPAASRQEYFPVAYAEPLENNRTVLGFDCGSVPAQCAALEQARDTGQAVATGRIALGGAASDHFGVLLLLPVYRGPTGTVQERRASLMGFAAVVIRVGEAVKQAIATLDHVADLDMRVLDRSAPEDQRLLYTHVSRSRSGQTSESAVAEAAEAATLRFSRKFALGGRHWDIVCTPAPAFLATHRAWGSWAFLAAGMLLTALLTAYLLALQGRTRKITELVEEKTAELKKSEERFDLAVRGSGDGIWDWNIRTDVIIYSPRFKELLGYEDAEFPDVFESLESCLHPDDHDPTMKALRDSAERQVGFDLEWRLRTKSGDYRWFNCRGLPAANTSGRCFRWLGTMRDITDRKQAEADAAARTGELQRQTAELEESRRVAIGIMEDAEQARQTAEAAKEELRQVNEHLEQQTTFASDMAAQAEMANAAKSEFLANMSHEIRTPMNGVIGMTGLLLDTELNDEQRRYAETVCASGESLLGIINDILDFSKIEAGKLDMEALDFDLHALLDDFAEMMALKVHEKGLEFLCAAEPDVPAYLRGDPGRLRQVLINLTGNAVKFTQEGEIAVRASLESEKGEEVLVRFSVRDTGIGIPADKQDGLFRQFTQVDTSTTRKYGGTGLGLAISKQLADMMGGEIGVSSEEGSGSEFWFTARFLKQPDRERDLAPPADVRGARILVVDDSATNREILLVRFKAWGARGDEASDGEMGLRLLREAAQAGDPYRVAVIDMQMPGMNGEELGRAIKADAALADTRLVMMTSLGQRGDARRLEEIGFAAYLTKPVRHSELFDGLAVVLSGETHKAARPIVTRHSIREIRRSAVRILLAEDNITNQQVALGILKRLSLSADAVANGRKAVKALESIPYDLVLMDCQMPEMDGYEATARIRDPQSKVSNHDIPIIAMTAHTMQRDREKCLEAGMNDYLSKPVAPQALAEMLDKWLPQERDEGQGTDDERKAESADGAGRGAASTTTPVFDRAAMMERLMDDEDLAQTVVATFLEDTPRQIGALKGHLDAGDIASAKCQAHSIKGASGNVGAEALREVAFEMENAGKAGDLTIARGCVAELEAQFDRLKEAMEEDL